MTSDEVSNILFKELMGVGDTNQSREFFEEPYKGKRYISPNQIIAEEDSIPNTAPVLLDGETSGVVQYYEKHTLNAVTGAPKAFYSADLKQAVPFTFGDGSYNYKLYDSLDNEIVPGDGEWVVYEYAGLLVYYGDLPPNQPPKISFYRYIGEYGVPEGGDISGSGATPVGIGGEYETISVALAAGKRDLLLVSDVTETVEWNSNDEEFSIKSQGAQKTINLSTNIDATNNVNIVRCYNIKFEISGIDYVFRFSELYLYGRCDIVGDSDANLFSWNLSLPNIYHADELYVDGGVSGGIRVSIKNADYLNFSGSFVVGNYQLTNTGMIQELVIPTGVTLYVDDNSEVLYAEGGGTLEIRNGVVRKGDGVIIFIRTDTMLVENCYITELQSYVAVDFGILELLKNCIIDGVNAYGVNDIRVIEGCTFQTGSVITIKEDGCKISNTTFVDGVNINADNVVLDNCTIGSVLGGGKTITVNATAENTFISNCWTEDPIVDNGIDTRIINCNGSDNVLQDPTVINTSTNDGSDALSIKNSDGLATIAIHDDGNIEGSYGDYIFYKYGSSNINNISYYLANASLSTSATGLQNTTVGTNLYSLTTGRNNSVFGFNIGASLTTGSHNVLLGTTVGNSLVNHNSNVMIGSGAGNNATASSCVLIGAEAGASVSGAYSIAIGAEAGEDNTGSCISIGRQSAKTNTGFGMVVIGSQALAGVNTLVSSYSVMLGYEVARLSTEIGLDNVCIGKQSAYASILGSYNIAIGSQSMKYCTGADNTVSIGRDAGYSSNSSESIFIGRDSGYYETVDNKLLITNQQGIDEADARSKALLHGDMSTTTANQTLEINAKTTVNNSIKSKGVYSAIETITADTSIDDNHHTILLNGSLNTVQIILPDSSGLDGLTYIFKAKDITNTVTIITSGTDIFEDTSTTFTFTSVGEKLKLQCDETNGEWIDIT